MDTSSQTSGYRLSQPLSYPPSELAVSNSIGAWLIPVSLDTAEVKLGLQRRFDPVPDPKMINATYMDRIATALAQKDMPITLDETSTLRVANTRVTLDTVVYRYQQGDDATSIVAQFPVLTVKDCRAAIAFYEQHRLDIDQYLMDRQRDADKLKREIESQQGNSLTRKELMARKKTKG